MDGFERGRKLDKVGLKAMDTAELFFREVRVPVANLLGAEGGGFGYLMANLTQERLNIETTLRYGKDRAASSTYRTGFSTLTTLLDVPLTIRARKAASCIAPSRVQPSA